MSVSKRKNSMINVALYVTSLLTSIYMIATLNEKIFIVCFSVSATTSILSLFAEFSKAEEEPN